MNAEQVTGTIRQWVPYLSGLATMAGLTWFDGVASWILTFSGPIGFLLSWAWSMVAKTDGNILTSAANIPNVESINLFDNTEGRRLARPDITPPNVRVIPAMRSASGHI